MGKYVPEIQFSTTWDGDGITATMEPMSREDFMQLAATRGPDLTLDETRVMAAVEDILKRRLRTLVGVRDGNGNAVQKEEILNRIYFVALVSELFAALKEGSTLGKVTSPGSEPK